MRQHRNLLFYIFAAVIFAAGNFLWAQDSDKKGGAPFSRKPERADVVYGPHERNVLDFWKAKSDQPGPLLIYIHGGGFEGGDKSDIGRYGDLNEILDRGISVAAINYRFLSTAPIQDILKDCARAVQFLRSKSGEWNIDAGRLAAFGDSGGGGASLWLAFHDDMADGASGDLVLKQSTRLSAAAALYAQCSYDILTWPALAGLAEVPVMFRGQVPPFYHLKTWEEVVGEEGQKIRAECDMLAMVSPGDPPVFLMTDTGLLMINLDQMLHHPRHAEVVLKRCQKIGVEAVGDIPYLKIRPGDDQAKNWKAFMLEKLAKP